MCDVMSRELGFRLRLMLLIQIDSTSGLKLDGLMERTCDFLWMMMGGLPRYNRSTLIHRKDIEDLCRQFQLEVPNSLPPTEPCITIQITQNWIHPLSTMAIMNSLHSRHIIVVLLLVIVSLSPSFAFQLPSIVKSASRSCGDAGSSTTTTSTSPITTTSTTRLFAGPRSEGRRRTSRDGTSAGPRPQRVRRERPVVASKFDGKELAASQISNEATAPPLDLTTAGLRCMSDDNLQLDSGDDVAQPSFEFLSLDSIHPGLSNAFNTDATFRNHIREAIRLDVFHSTPAYAKLSEKAASIMLLPDSSLQGSWRKPATMDDNELRMKRLTKVLKEKFGDDADDVPTGDDLMHKIGALCGPVPSTHWIDIVGVQDRKLSHSWHLDTGLSPENSRTLLWGFPAENDFSGCGIFSHIVPLRRECHAPEGHPRMEPILFDGGTIDEDFIVRLLYAPGKELLVYRDIDVLHSSPDIAYRTSVMRFM